MALLTPNELMEAARCFQCLDGTQMGAVVVYEGVAYANGGIPPEDQFEFGNPDEDWVFGEPGGDWAFGG